ncbi:unnamed protein product [Heligmosomoides polygyrus]|uniref:Uncharacterized protein n=1 Tax=Heligmosomoides polygyrus TaxID=6339 RepID=A0A3P8F197_HELPZ|nr:unnamed protein product [Heligmosomoides polygyrus]
MKARIEVFEGRDRGDQPEYHAKVAEERHRGNKPEYSVEDQTLRETLLCGVGSLHEGTHPKDFQSVEKRRRDYD